MKCVLSLCVLALLHALPVAAQAPQQAPAQKPQPAAGQKPQPRTAQALTVSVQVTDREGTPLNDVTVGLTGPVERTGVTAEGGRILFRTLRAGTYRLRFEHEAFVTLEREVVLRPGGPVELSVSLSPAPAAPAPEPAPPAADPAPEPTSTTGRAVDPRLLSIPDFLDKNLIGSEPQRRTLLGCADGGTARLLQIRDPLEGQLHDDVDEILYVVAGAGVVRIRNQDTRVGPGHFALVPRGVPHSIRRDGRNPLIALSIFAGAPCTDTDAGLR